MPTYRVLPGPRYWLQGNESAARLGRIRPNDHLAAASGVTIAPPADGYRWPPTDGWASGWSHIPGDDSTGEPPETLWKVRIAGAEVPGLFVARLGVLYEVVVQR
jgi:hypothetical protein